MHMFVYTHICRYLEWSLFLCAPYPGLLHIGCKAYMLLCEYTHIHTCIRSHTHTHTDTWIGALSCVLRSQDSTMWEVNLTRCTHAHTHAYRHLDWRPVLCAPLPRLHHVVQGWGWRLLDPGAIQESQGRPLTATPDCCPWLLPLTAALSTCHTKFAHSTAIVGKVRKCWRVSVACHAIRHQPLRHLVVALKIGCNEAAPGNAGVGNRASGACIYYIYASLK